jgi:RecA-family ATPase
LKGVTPPEVDWVIKDVAAVGALSLMVGAPGMGKSFLSLALASGVASGGVDVAGFQTEHGAVVAFDAENGSSEIHRRCNTLDLYRNCRIADVSGGFSLVHDREEIYDAAVPAPVKLVILDSLRTLCPELDENSSDEVTMMLSGIQTLARESDVAVLILHHLNKTGTFRGSGAMTAVPEIVIRMYGDENDQYNRRSLTWEKFRLGSRPDRKWITLKDGRVSESWHPRSD